MSTRDIFPVETFFSVVDAFEDHLQKESEILQNADADTHASFVKEKIDLSKNYERHLQIFEDRESVQQLDPVMKKEIRDRLKRVQSALERNIQFLESYRKASLEEGRILQQSLLQNRVAPFYNRRGSVSIMSEASLALSKRI